MQTLFTLLFGHYYNHAVKFMCHKKLLLCSELHLLELLHTGLALECGTGEFQYTANEGPVKLILQVCVLVVNDVTCFLFFYWMYMLSEKNILLDHFFYMYFSYHL